MGSSGDRIYDSVIIDLTYKIEILDQGPVYIVYIYYSVTSTVAFSFR